MIIIRKAHQASQVMLPSTAFILFAEAHQAEASRRTDVIYGENISYFGFTKHNPFDLAYSNQKEREILSSV